MYLHVHVCVHVCMYVCMCVLTCFHHLTLTRFFAIYNQVLQALAEAETGQRVSKKADVRRPLS